MQTPHKGHSGVPGEARQGSITALLAQLGRDYPDYVFEAVPDDGRPRLPHPEDAYGALAQSGDES